MCVYHRSGNSEVVLVVVVDTWMHRCTSSIKLYVLVSRSQWQSLLTKNYVFDFGLELGLIALALCIISSQL